MTDRRQAEKFLDEVASAIYPLLAKHRIKQDDFICEPSVIIRESVTNSDAFKNVSRGGI